MPEEVCGETPYYMLDVLKSKLWPPSTACDREAYWVKRAYDKELFDLVFGLWSGALDIMTFLGMLTVSMVSVRRATSRVYGPALLSRH